MDNRANILKHALDLFAARGYDAVGVQEIAEAAGITKPTLYHYFGSKEGLLSDLLDEQFGRLLEKLRAVPIVPRDMTLTLRRVMDVYLADATHHPDFHRLYLALYFAPPRSPAFATVNRFVRRPHQFLEELFLQAAGAHGNMKGRHARYAASFLGMLNTYIGMHVNGFVELNEPVKQQALHQFMHGIFS
jgi:AcrR family transcriptional regulator